MKWYFCLNGEATSWFANMIKVAVISARANSDLEPHCIFDGQDNELTYWLRRKGVQVHISEVWFRDRLFDEKVIRQNLGTNYSPSHASGYYLLLQILEIEINDQYVLFTDCDVMFHNRFDLSEIKPKVLAAAPEIADTIDPLPTKNGIGFNSGVMVLNVPELRSMKQSIVDSLESHSFFQFPGTRSTYDQGLLNAVFAECWEHLDVALNWRVFFGINHEASVVHWHGPKPIHVADIATGRFNPAYTTTEVERLVRRAAPAYRHYFDIYRRLLVFA